MESQGTKHRSAAAAVVAALVAGCATNQPIPHVTRPDGAVVAIQLNVADPSNIGSHDPAQVYFAKIDNQDGILQQQFIRSNYVTDNRAYLLNARPGTYVAVASLFRAPVSPATYTTYFPRDLVEQTKVTVHEHEFAFMGSCIVDSSVGLGGADAVQTHYKNVIAPSVNTGMLSMAFSGEVQYRGTLRERKNDAHSRSAFFRQAKEDLKGSDWTALVP